MHDADLLLSEALQGLDQARLDWMGENHSDAVAGAMMAQARAMVVLAMAARKEIAGGAAPAGATLTRGAADLLRDAVQDALRGLERSHPARERVGRAWNQVARALAADGCPVGDLGL